MPPARELFLANLTSPQRWSLSSEHFMAQMIILGIVQGLTEFLPVSSTAHLLFAEHFLHVQRPGIVLEAILHLGTALAAIVLFWPDVRRLLTGFVASLRRDARSDESRAFGRLAWLIILATAITGGIGLLFLEPLERMFGSIRGTALQLIVSGVILLFARERGRRNMVSATPADAAFIGLAQGLAIIPGISRSGTTIAAAMWSGLAREEAARLSFLVAIPALIGAGLFSLRELGAARALGYTTPQLLVGFAVSAVFGAAAIRWLLIAVRRRRLLPFAIYCWTVGLVVFLVSSR